MTPELWQRVEAGLSRALELPRSEREAFLAGLRAEDAELAQEVESLIKHESSSVGWLEPTGKQPLAKLMGDPVTLTMSRPFGPYRIERLLGAGGMGEVYLALDSRLNRRVALKLLGGWLYDDEQLISRFTQEALSASALNHPNIPVVYEAGEIDGRYFIASEFVDGFPLGDRIKDGPIPWREAVSIALKLASALQAAHRAGIIHRDVKPSNVLIGGDGKVKLVDFGIAKSTRQDSEKPGSGYALTMVGAAIGTPGYMAPEQADGQAADARSDIWSLTAVLHEMLTGKRPGAGSAAWLRAAGIPTRLQKVLEHGLETEPGARFQTMDAFMVALEASGGLVARLPFGIWTATAAMAVMAVISGWLGWHAMRTPSARAPSLAVLRFENLPAGSANSYFTTGIQEEVLTHLGRISGLKVLSAHAVSNLPPHPESLKSVGNLLDVSTVLEGSVQVQDKRMRVSVQLIDTESRAQLWADSYDRDIKDVFDVERDIAERVAGQLQAVLLTAERAQVEVVDTLNPEAHSALLQARFFRRRGDESSLRKALEKLDEAIQLDPAYAQAYAETSTAWYYISDYLSGPELARAKAKARAAAQRALELAPNLAEAHVALGWVSMVWDWDFHAAEHEFSTAVRLSPNLAQAQNGLGTLYAYQGQFEDSARRIKQARVLDPLSSAYALNLALVRQALGQPAEGEKLVREALALEPSSATCHLFLAELALDRGKSSQAQIEAKLEPDPGSREFALTEIAQITGYPADARVALQNFIRSYGTDLPFRVAELEAVRGDADAMFAWLDRAFDSRDGGTVELLLSMRFKPYYVDPRFIAFCRKFGIPPPGQPPLKAA